MAKVTIDAGICGYTTVVNTHMDGDDCVVEITGGCDDMKKLAKELTRVDPFGEISFRGAGPLTLQLLAKQCKHPACPVGAGIIKAVEVAAGLALPKDASIKVEE